MSEEPTSPLGLASAWLERWGVVTRGQIMADGVPGGFAAAYRLLSELEASGKVLRGYLIDGLGAAQFSTPEVIDQLRTFTDGPALGARASGPTRPEAVVLAAADPANPYGAILPWPEHPDAHPSRASGALVVLRDGLCLAHLTRGGRALTLFGDDRAKPERAALVARALMAATRSGRIRQLRVEEIDGLRAGATDLAELLRAAGARLTPKGLVFDAPVV